MSESSEQMQNDDGKSETPPSKRMSAKEFRKLGLLQEVNRQYLHPMGLALEVVVFPDGSEYFGDLRDFRHDPEGIVFADPPCAKSAKSAMKLFESKRLAREAIMGWHVQPVT